MATKQADTLRDVTCNGTFGNLNKAIGKAVLAADAATTVIEVLRLEAGTTITGVAVHHGANGASTGVTVGYAYVDSDNGVAVPDAFATVADTSAAGTANYDGEPIVLDYPVIVTATVTGGAATGHVTIVPEYIYVGAK